VNTNSLSSRDHLHIWHPFTPQVGADSNIAILKGKGSLLFDEEGQAYIDAISSWWVNLHGHCNAFIADKLKQQLGDLEHVLFSGYTHEPAILLAEKLKALLPAMDKVFFSDDGSTAVEVALKMALQYWHNKGETRTKVIAFENAYHGDTFGSMSVGARNIFSRAFEPLLFDVIRIPVPVKGKEEESVNALRKALDGNTAAFIFEPLVQGAAGMIMYDCTALDQLLEMCKLNNVPAIADEVMTGFGRTGKMFATDYCNTKPDIICLSKGITGGFMPLGVTMCSARMYEPYLTSDRTKTFFHGHSYTANPLACAAGVASLEWFEIGNVWSEIHRISEQLAQAKSALSTHPNVADVRLTGTILAIEIKSYEATGYLNSVGESVAHYFHKRGIIMRPLGNVVYVLPPYCTTEHELSIVLDAIAEFLNGQ